MVVHCRVVHERRRDHQCPHCSSRFGTAADMRRHCKTVHEKVRAHACIYCPEDVAFGTMGNLNKHIDTVHLKMREHACPYCKGVAFGTKSRGRNAISMPEAAVRRAFAAIDAAEVAGGVVLFTTGTYRIDGTLRVEASDVVLRGEGADATSRWQTPVSSRRETRWRLVGRSRPSSSLSTE